MLNDKQYIYVEIISILYNFIHSQIDGISRESKVRHKKSKYPEQIAWKTSYKVVWFFLIQLTRW